MDSQKKRTVNIINRNYPPDSGVTGGSAAELVGFLLNKGVRVNVIHVDAAYQKTLATKEPLGNTYKIPTFYNGKNKTIRLFSNLYENIRMLLWSKSLKPDLTICMTEPPLLSVCAALMFNKREKWILWSMDLYPEALSAGRIISKKNWLYRVIDNIVTRNKPRHIIALGNYQIDYLRKKFGKEITFTMLPCGIFDVESTNISGPVPHWAEGNSGIILGYCGNLGEAHSEEFIISVIKNLNPRKHKLMLAVYGSKAKKLQDFAAGKPGVEIVNFVHKHELKYIDVHLASLNHEWVNVCVPSKTVSSVCSGSAFLYCGKKESDNWDLLHDAGWLLPAEVPDFDPYLSGLFAEIESSLEKKKVAAAALSVQLQRIKQEAFLDIYQQIIRITRPGS